MPILSLFLMLALGFMALPAKAQNSDVQVKNILAIQQASIASLKLDLAKARQAAADAAAAATSAATAAANAQRAADNANTAAIAAQASGDGANSLANSANSAAARAQSTADAAANKIFVAYMPGHNSCQNTCWDNGHASCLVALAGSSPSETWTCNARPEGGLACVCLR